MFIGFYRVLLGLTGFDRILQDINGIDLVSVALAPESGIDRSHSSD